MILFVNRKQLFCQQCHDTRHIYQSNTIQWIAVHGQSNSNKYTILIKDVVQIIIDFNFNLGSPSCVESEVNDESRSGIYTEGPGGLQMQSLSATQNSTSYWSMYIYVTNDYVKTPVITNEDGFRRNMNMSPTALVDDNEFLGAIPVSQTPPRYAGLLNFYVRMTWKKSRDLLLIQGVEDAASTEG